MVEENRQHIDPRNVLAAERTLLAWIRTGLAMMGFGFVVARFGIFLRALAAPAVEHRPGTASVWAGTALVIAGVTATIAGLFDHRRVVRLLGDGRPIEYRFQPAIVIAVSLAAIGIALAVYLLIAR